MRSRIGHILYAGLALMVLLPGCRPQVDVLAPEKELYAVYGVLHPARDSQYVRVAKVFQFDGDALAYAGSDDLSASGLKVTLKGPDTSYTAELVRDQPKEPGVFFREQAVYLLHTPPGNRLQAGERYTLDITKYDDPDFSITAWTDIPTQPSFISPGGAVYSPQEQLYTYTTMDFHEDQSVRFYMGTGKGFELRLYVDFWDGTRVSTARWGPSRIFLEPEGCIENADKGRMCYEIRKRIVPVSLRKYVVAAPGPVAVLDSVRVARSLDSLSRHVRLEVTAVDSFLTYFLHSNTPFGYGLNLLMDKPEISNISGGNIGIFGSINTGTQYIYLGPCARYHAGLSTSAPGHCE